MSSTRDPNEELLYKILSRAEPASRIDHPEEWPDDDTLVLFAMGDLTETERDEVLSRLEKSGISRKTLSTLISMNAETSAQTVSVDMELQRGRLYLSLNRPEAAHLEFRTAAEFAPDNPAAWLGLGEACRALHDLENAEKAFRRCLELQADNAEVITHLADALEEQSRPGDAINLWQQLLTGELTAHQHKLATESVRRLRNKQEENDR